MQENFIYYQGSRLHYAVAGNGPRTLLIFHGFGQDHQAFEHWVQTLESECRFYVFDLYFHGQSTWPNRRPLEKNDWKQILTQFLEQEKIDLFELVGFSLGGKFALATLEGFREKVTKITLLAPDGIQTNFWYSFATYPIAIRTLFKSMILNPGRFNGIAKLLRAIGLVDKGLLRFAESQMDTEEKRNRVYYSWVYFRHLRFDIAEIAAILNHHQIPLLMIAGKYDKVIPAENMNRFLKKLDRKQMEIIEAGHNDLIRNAAKYLS